jgi:hypothetical protein
MLLGLARFGFPLQHPPGQSRKMLLLRIATGKADAGAERLGSRWPPVAERQPQWTGRSPLRLPTPRQSGPPTA